MRTGALVSLGGQGLGTLFRLEYATYSDADIDDISRGYNLGAAELLGGIILCRA